VIYIYIYIYIFNFRPRTGLAKRFEGACPKYW